MRQTLLLLLFLPLLASGQDDLLTEIDTTVTQQPVESAFKALKIVNLESTKLAAKKDFYAVIAHRFGSVKGGFESFWGLDNAITQIKLLYGLTDWLNVAAARSELAYDFSVKYRLQPQMDGGFPICIVMYNSLSFNNTLKESLYPRMTFENRLVYVTQVLVSRKFTEKFSFELAPSFFHENFVVDDNQENSQFALGVGARYKVAKRWSINVDYASHLNRSNSSPYRDPLSIGVDLETGGHVFQMHFTNSQGIHEAGFLGNTTGDWGRGDIFFGFNLLRVF